MPNILWQNFRLTHIPTSHHNTHTHTHIKKFAVKYVVLICGDIKIVKRFVTLLLDLNRIVVVWLVLAVSVRTSYNAHMYVVCAPFISCLRSSASVRKSKAQNKENFVVESLLDCWCDVITTSSHNIYLYYILTTTTTQSRPQNSHYPNNNCKLFLISWQYIEIVFNFYWTTQSRDSSDMRNVMQKWSIHPQFEYQWFNKLKMGNKNCINFFATLHT